MKNKVLIVLVTLITVTRTNAQDITTNFTLPDSVRVIQFMSEFNIKSVPSKKEGFAGIKADGISLVFESEKGKNEIWGTGRNKNYELGIEDGKNRNEFTFILKDENELNLSWSSSNLIPLIWSPENHKFFPNDFKKRIETFYLSLKKIQFKTGIKIPKFVIFEIIKFTI